MSKSIFSKIKTHHMKSENTRTQGTPITYLKRIKICDLQLWWSPHKPKV